MDDDTDDARVLTRAALLYYRAGATQQQVAERIGVSRATVGRLLARARETGIVTIEVAADLAREAELEVALEERYGLIEALVIESTVQDELGHPDLGPGCADVLVRRLRSGYVLGLGWSRLSRSAADSLRSMSSRTEGLSDVVVVQMAGAAPSSPGAWNPVRTVAAVADALDATEHLISAPLYVDQPSTATSLLTDRGIAAALATAATAQICMFGIGDVTQTTPLFLNGYVEADQLDRLVGLGAVGDIGGRFFDAQGREVDPDLAARTVSLPLDQIRSRPVRIAAAAGPARVAALHAAFEAGLANVVVTDHATATALLQDAAPAPGAPSAVARRPLDTRSA